VPSRLLALCATVFSLGALSISTPAHAAPGCPWMNRALLPDARTDLLLKAMRPTDKLALLTGVDVAAPQWAPLAGGAVGYVPANPRLCIPALVLNDGGAGVGDFQTGTTAFPAPIAQAATWDPLRARALGQAIGLEAWLKGIDVFLAPDVNIARVPQNGRNFEAFGEDPFLSGQIAAAEIQGVQRNPVIATVKHFAVNSQETNRWYVSSNLDNRTLHEIYLPPFEAAVNQGHVGAVMCAYGAINGHYSCEDGGTLKTVLRKQLGFDGFVISDWHAVQADTAGAANGGMDLQMPTGTLAQAVGAGQVLPATIDRMARGVLHSMFEVGLFDHPPAPHRDVRTTDVSTTADQLVARRAELEGSVLLKNDGPILPLQVGPGQRIAVIGAPAGALDLAPYLSGGGSGYVAGTKAVSPLQGLTALAGARGATVDYADGSDPAAAAAAASGASAAIVFVYDKETEGQDRQTLALPDGQDTLIAQIVRANPRTIVVLMTGGPVLMPWLGSVPALLEAWYPGQQAGTAIAALLFGDVSPSGKLPETFPTSDAAVPVSTQAQWPGANDAQQASFSEGLFVGYRWYDHTHTAPLFPFGFGLSYTRFSFDALHLRKRTDGGVDLTFTLANTGSRPGVEVTQVYVDDPQATGEPPKQLFGFRRVFLTPGASARVRITLGWRAFAQWDIRKQDWVVTPGLYRLLVGDSSRDLPLRGFYQAG
jgi:beta-glucosidase